MNTTAVTESPDPDRVDVSSAQAAASIKSASVSPADPRWVSPAFWLLILATAVGYSTNLASNGWANSFYSAAAQAGSTNWTAFLFGSLDGANSITVDKPPAALWVMSLSVRVFGLNSWSMLLPEVAMGVASVALLYATVRRVRGPVAGLLAGLVLALTPVAVLMFRFNNPDALLVLLMVAAAWATTRAISSGSYRWMAFAGFFIGLGFLTKTLQVLLVVPPLGVAYLLAAPGAWRRRLTGACIGLAAMVVSAGWWVVLVELTPASKRPYIGGSQHNSFLELTFGYNGLGRLNGDETGSVGGGRGWGATGLWRMFDTSNGGQISWLLPAALIFLVAGLWWTRRAPRTDMHRAAYVIWGGWLLVTALTFSFMAGIFHEYYTVALAPAVAALVGLGAVHAWERRADLSGSVVLALATASSAAWGYVLLSRTSDGVSGWRYAVLLVGLASALGLLGVGLTRRPILIALPLVAGLVAVLAGPAAYAVTTVNTPARGSIVTAGPRTGSGPGGGPGRGPGGGGVAGPGQGQGQGQQAGQQGAGPGAPGGMGGLLNAGTPSAAVIQALQTDADSYTWVAAAVGSQRAAGLQLGARYPVMAIGGFNGSDPSPTLTQFQEAVSQHRIHYFAAGGGEPGGGLMRGTLASTSSQGSMGTANGGSQVSSQISTWVQQNFTPVTVDGQSFYDLTKPVAA